jgi:peptide/nickel transport system permease protein
VRDPIFDLRRKISDFVNSRPVLSMRRRFTEDKFAGFSLVIVIILFFTVAFAPLLAPYPYDEMALERKLQPPSWEFPMGTDSLGRDILSRLIYGSRIVVYVIGTTTLVAGLLGVVLGLISGYFGGVIDHLVMRISDVLLAFPSMIIALAVVSVLGLGLENLVTAITITQIAPYARLIRGRVLTVKELQYVENARTIGCSHWRIIIHHILPNSASPILVQAAFSAGSCLLSVAGLSFMGLGAQPPTPEWGLMLYEARPYMRYSPHAMIFPGLAIFLVVLSFNTIGEVLRDILDPRIQLERV